MSNNPMKVRRRTSGQSGSPASLKGGEIAHNEVSDILYIGKGDNGTGVATDIVPFAGKGYVVDVTSAQSIDGNKSFVQDVNVPSVAYGAGWNNSNAAPTRGVLYAVIEAIKAIIADGDKGDIIISASGASWAIDINVVSNSKLAQMATKTYKGRTSAGTGNAEDVPVATLKSDLALTKTDVGLGNVDNTSDANKPVSTAQQTALDLKANLASPALSGIPTVPTAPVGTNTTQISSTQFVINEIGARLASNDALLYKGAIDCSTNPNYPAADAGNTYRISVAGRIGGAAGAKVEAGDRITCNVDSTAAGTQATVGANWDITQTNIDGAATIDGVQTLTFKTMSGANNTFSNIPNTAITGLGTMSTQNANAVAITGGTIDNVSFDGGTF